MKQNLAKHEMSWKRAKELAHDRVFSVADNCSDALRVWKLKDDEIFVFPVFRFAECYDRIPVFTKKHQNVVKLICQNLTFLLLRHGTKMHIERKFCKCI